MNNILTAILFEIESAESKYPIWPECHIRRAAIVAEEAGELIREANLLSEGKGNIENLKTEAIQTAATAIRFLKLLDNPELKHLGAKL